MELICFENTNQTKLQSLFKGKTLIECCRFVLPVWCFESANLSHRPQPNKTQENKGELLRKLWILMFSLSCRSVMSKKTTCVVEPFSALQVLI